MSATTSDPKLSGIASLHHPGRIARIERARALAQVVRMLLATVHGPALLWFAITLLTGLVPPFQLWAAGRLVDGISARVGGETGSEPWLWATLMIVVLVLSRGLLPLEMWALSLIRERGVPEVHARIYAQATGVDLAVLEYQAFHDSTQRVAEQANDALVKLMSDLRALVASMIITGGTMLLIGRVDWRLLVVLLLSWIPGLLTSARAGLRVWHTLTDQTRDRRLAAYIAARFSDRQAAKEIRLFGLRDLLLDRWAHHFMTTRNQLRWKTTRLMLGIQAGGSLGTIISFAGLIWIVTGTDVDLSAGEITVLMTAFMTIGNQLYSIQQALMALGEASGFALDARAILRLPTPFAVDGTSDASGPAPGALIARDLRFAYPGTARPVIDGISLIIPPGQVVAIVGENGAGKTTLLKLLLGLYTPDAGDVCLGSRSLRDMPVSERQERFSAVFQHFSRYPLTLAENITLHAPHRTDRLVRAIGDAGLDRTVTESPNSADTLLAPDLGGIDLSGGQWQRVAIARAGYRNADILALDEPTAALDPLAEVDIFRRFATLAEGRTTLLVSHRLGMARLADRIVVIEHGRITEDGTHEELLRRRGHYAGLWEMQARWYA